MLKIVGRQILDSRGNPTVEVDVITYRGLVSRLLGLMLFLLLEKLS